jgi:hypothetical protein
MRYFRVKNFNGLRNQAEQTTLDRGSLTLCENVIPYPKGCLQSPPKWEQVYQNINLSGNADSLVDIMDGNGNHVIVSRNNSGVAVGLGWASSKTLDGKKNPHNEATLVDANNHLNGGFISQVGREFFIGDGKGDNIHWGDSTNRRFDKLSSSSGSPDTALYGQANEIFPPATSFVVGPDKSIYAAGSTTSPLSVYVSEPATIANPDSFSAVQGMFSGVMSEVKIIMSNATKITALSTFRNYVVVHTNAGVVLLYRTEKNQAGTGYRVEQTASPTVAGAVNPNSASANMGVRPFYLGTDGQIYKDESARAGQDHTTEGRLREIATWSSVESWNRYVDHDLSKSFTAFEPSLEFFLSAVPHMTQDVSEGYPMFLFNGETNAFSGPNLYPRFQAMTHIHGTSKILGIDRELKFWVADFALLREQPTINIPDPITASSGSPKVYLKKAEVHPSVKVLADADGKLLTTSRSRFVGYGADTSEFLDIYYDDGTALPMRYGGAFSTPTKKELPADLSEFTEFNQSTLSIIETAYEDMGAPESVKNFMEVFLKFQTNSIAQVGVYAETEDGLTAGRWIGDITKDDHKVFLNLRGKQIKIRIYVIAQTDFKWLLKDFQIGHIIQNTI